MEKLNMENIILDLAKALPEHEMIRKDVVAMTGKDLKLTGVKNYKGEKLNDDTIYPIDVPVFKAIKLQDGEPVLKVIDHRHHLRTAWLRNGLKGIFEYLEKYMTADQIFKIKKYFIRISHA